MEKKNLEATIAGLEKSVVEKDKVMQELRMELHEREVQQDEYMKGEAVEKAILKRRLKWLIFGLIIALCTWVKVVGSRGDMM